MGKKIVKILLLGVVGLIVIGVIASGDKKTSSSDGGKYGSVTKGSPSSTESPVAANRPSDQNAFIKIVTDAIKASDAAANDMARGGVLADRTSAICKALGSMNITNWTGYVESVDSNSDGKGVLAVSIFRNVKLQTWNNAVSDVVDETLITPGSSVFKAASELKSGDSVKFSGSFVSDSETCIGEQSLSLIGKLEEPEFTFRFSQIAKLPH